MLAWLASKPRRKAVSVSRDAAVLRQFYCYLRRQPGRSLLREPLWQRLPTESSFVPHIFSKEEILRLLELSAQLVRPSFRAALYRALLLLLYCTALRIGEALRLCLRDVDTRSGVLFVVQFKGRARWVPFHRALSPELNKYLRARDAFPFGRASRRFPAPP